MTAAAAIGNSGAPGAGTDAEIGNGIGDGRD